MQYLHNIDMRQNELQNAVIQPSNTAPANPKVGQLYTDISGNEPKIRWWNGTKWIDLGSAAPDKVPSKKEPSVSIRVLDMEATDTEVGMTIPITYDTDFIPGSYTYGPDTGVTVESWKIYDTEGNNSTSPDGTFSGVTVGDSTSYKLTVEATHSAGVVPLTEQGNPYPAAQISSGTKKSSTSSISGFRKYFYGTRTEISAMRSDIIRSLTHSSEAIGDGASFDLKIPEGANQVIIAFPSSANLSLESVIDTGAFNIEVYDIFEKEVVPVEGANGYTAIDYDVYVYTPDVSLGANKYKVTIS